MSASREKNRRKAQSQTGAPEVPQQKQKGLSKGVKTAFGIVVAVVVIAVIAFFAMLSNGFFARHTTAAKVGEHSLSPVEVNYFAADAYATFYNQLGSYASMFFDTSTALSEQVYDEDTGKTWADYFIDQGLQTAASTYAVYDEAVANGFTLTAAQEQSVTDQIEQLREYVKTYASDYYNTLDAFLVAQYGVGCDTKTYESYLRVQTVASAYSSSVSEALTYTTEEIDAEYAGNVTDYDTVSYRYVYFAADDYAEESDSDEELSEEVQEQLLTLELAQAKTDADAMLEAITDEQSFIDLAVARAEADAEEDETVSEDDSLASDYSYSSVPSAAADWLFDEARVEGDTACLDSDAGYYVVYFLSRNDHSDSTRNVRHILVSVSDSTDETEVANARAQAEAILAEYQAGEQTEDAFAALGEKYLDDGTSAEATRYDNVYVGQMVEEFENWCFDESRQIGDVAVVDTSYGSHVMYFCGEGELNHRQALAENALKSSDYSAWYSALTENASYEAVSTLFVNKL